MKIFNLHMFILKIKSKLSYSLSFITLFWGMAFFYLMLLNSFFLMYQPRYKWCFLSCFNHLELKYIIIITFSEEALVISQNWGLSHYYKVKGCLFSHYTVPSSKHFVDRLFFSHHISYIWKVINSKSDATKRFTFHIEWKVIGKLA